MESISSNPSDSIDRISPLQDSILGKILSYLPTKNAIATSILSTRWGNLFPSKVPLRKIDLDDDHLKLLYRERGQEATEAQSRAFVDFANKLLNITLRNVQFMETVEFNFENEYDDGQIASWLSSALRFNFRRLKLQVAYAKESEDLLDVLNGYSSLVELELGSEFQLYVPQRFALPSLKKLSLWQLVLRNDSDSIRALLKGCPLLEDLSFNYCSFEVLNLLPIRSRLLKRLCIDDTKNEAECRVVIDAPNLEFFMYSGHAIPDFAAKSFKAPIACFINFTEMDEMYNDEDDEFPSDYPRHVSKIVQACSSTIRLYLSGRAMKALLTSSVELPKFDKLTCLALGRVGDEGWNVLAQLFLNACNLESLRIEEGFCKHDKGGYAKFESSLTSLPLCLTRFKKIELWKFKGLQDELKLIKFFLRYGLVLEEVVIHCLPWEDMSFFNRLLAFPRSSRSCQILFKEKSNWRTRFAGDLWFRTRS